MCRQEMHPQRKGQCLYPGSNTPSCALRDKQAEKKALKHTAKKLLLSILSKKIKCYWEFSAMGWSQDYLAMSFRVRKIEHDFTTTQKGLWNGRHNPSPWAALQLWQKAPGNTEMHWPDLWMQLEGTVLGLVLPGLQTRQSKKVSHMLN